MGTIAEAMLNGEICEQCGEELGETYGHPKLCAGCELEANAHVTPRKTMRDTKGKKAAKTIVTN